MLVGSLAIQTFLYYPKLPDTMASHFGANGMANGFQSKPVFFAFFLGLVAVAAIFAYGVPAIISYKPEMTNLPNKEKWLAPEHRAGALSFLAAHFTGLGCAMLVLGNVLLYEIVQFHLRQETSIPASTFVTILVSFLMFVAYWSFRLFTRLGSFS